MQDINIAVCGHASHGKSTLIGKAVAELGMVSRKRLEKAREAARQGRDPSHVYSNLVFRSKTVKPQSEAGRGITLQTAIIRFEFEGRRVTVIDTPGQELYTNNLFIGMFQADGALLLVSAASGIQPGTEQILRILVGFEIPLLGVSITKMDQVEYSQEAFEERVTELRLKLDEFGIAHESVVFFPTSAYERGRELLDPGEGVTRYDHCGWFGGPTFKGFLEDLSYDEIRPSEPLRAVVHPSEAYDNVPGIGKAMTAVIECGSIRPNDTLVFEPVSTECGELVTADVKSLELTRGHIATPGLSIDEAKPRQLVGIAISRLSRGGSLRDVFNGRGIVIGRADCPPSTALRMIIEVTIYNDKIQVRKGAEWVLHAHLDHISVRLEKIVAYRCSGENEWLENLDVEKEDIAEGDWARVQVKLPRPIAIEEAGVLPYLSRIVLREGNKAVGFGRCIKILEGKRVDFEESGIRPRKSSKDSGSGRRAAVLGDEDITG